MAEVCLVIGWEKNLEMGKNGFPRYGGPSKDPREARGASAGEIQKY